MRTLKVLLACLGLSFAAACAAVEEPGEDLRAVVACSLADVGTAVTCRIGNAYCSYRPDVNGSPTFCNDAPFPNHSFTLLVWGQDWSDFDGQCLLVTGKITRFRGKPQIEATRRSQVEFC